MLLKLGWWFSTVVRSLSNQANFSSVFAQKSGRSAIFRSTTHFFDNISPGDPGLSFTFFELFILPTKWFHEYANDDIHVNIHWWCTVLLRKFFFFYLLDEAQINEFDIFKRNWNFTSNFISNFISNVKKCDGNHNHVIEVFVPDRQFVTGSWPLRHSNSSLWAYFLSCSCCSDEKNKHLRSWGFF